MSFVWDLLCFLIFCDTNQRLLRNKYPKALFVRSNKALLVFNNKAQFHSCSKPYLHLWNDALYLVCLFWTLKYSAYNLLLFHNQTAALWEVKAMQAPMLALTLKWWVSDLLNAESNSQSHFLSSGSKVLQNDEFTKDLFRFLQLLCEGHNNGRWKLFNAAVTLSCTVSLDGTAVNMLPSNLLLF